VCHSRACLRLPCPVALEYGVPALDNGPRLLDLPLRVVRARDAALSVMDLQKKVQCIFKLHKRSAVGDQAASYLFFLQKQLFECNLLLSGKFPISGIRVQA